MAVSREVYRLHRSPAPTSVVIGDGKGRQVVFVITLVLAMLALYAVMSHVVEWGRVKYDDMRYGRPRSFHLAVPAGADGEKETHFLAMNLNRQVVVFEIPEGEDTTHIRTLQGPYLFGAGEDLTPVTLHMQDKNHDNNADLILRVKDEEVIYLDRDGTFSLMTAGERQRLIHQQ